MERWLIQQLLNVSPSFSDAETMLAASPSGEQKEQMKKGSRREAEAKKSDCKRFERVVVS